MTDVETFLTEAKIDKHARELFLSLDPELQQQVMAVGDFQGAHNPSSALMGRIKTAKQQAQGQQPWQWEVPAPIVPYPEPRASNGGGMHGGQFPPVSGMHGGQFPPVSLDTFIQESHVDEMAEQIFRGIASELQAEIIAMGPLSNAKNPSSALLGRIKQVQQNREASTPTVSDRDIEMFVSEGKLDERAEEAFRGLDRRLQLGVMCLGPLSNAKNPSSAVLGRIRQVQQQARQAEHWGVPMEYFWASYGPPSAWNHGAGSIDQFITDSGLDDRAEEALRSLDPVLQQELMAMGPLNNAHNPSSACLARIRQMWHQAKQAGKGAAGFEQTMKAKPNVNTGPNGRARKAAEDFLATANVDDRAQESFRALDPSLQAEVIALGPLDNAKNPSAALQGRVRQAQQGASASAWGPAPWQGGGGGGGGGPGWYGGGGGGGGGWGFYDDLEQFIFTSRLDPGAENALRNLDFETQAAVMAMGPLDNVQNPSSAVLGRIKQMRNQAEAGAAARAPAWGGKGPGKAGGDQYGAKGGRQMWMAPPIMPPWAMQGPYAQKGALGKGNRYQPY